MPTESTADPELAPCTLGDLVRYFLRLGTTGFGGPIALAGYMQRDLVERRRWISRQDYKDGLALAQLAPGPLAAQLAIYLGWVRGRALGGTLVGVAFVLPSFVMVLALAAAYVAFGGLDWMTAAFYGIGAAVIAIIGRSAIKLCKLTLARDWMLWAVFVANTAVTAITESEILSLVVASGAAVLIARRLWKPPPVAVVVPPVLVTGLHGPATAATLGKIAWFFTKAGAFVFGSGLAIVPFLYGGVVEHFHWLDRQQFLDAVAVAMITPGPVVITVAFIGYLVGGPAGATVAALATFLPCWLFTVVPAPYFRRWSQHPGLRAFVDGVTAAATGSIAGAAIVLARRSLVDGPTIAIAVITLGLLLRFKKLPEPLVILAAGVAGFVITRVAG